MASQICIVLIVLVVVAYLIVLERKGLGMVQLRQGPNKVGWKGLLQPVADGVKLFIKELSYTFFTTKLVFLIGPMMLFFLALALWLIFPGSSCFFYAELSALFFLCVSSCNVYGVFMCGWCCNSRYGMLGAMRAVAQVISYEVVMSSLLFCPLIMIGSFDVSLFMDQSYFKLFVIFDVFILWFIVILAELNRTPFDFVEGESELVAGYSVEYGGGGFALIALGEYSNILFLGVFSAAMFCSFRVIADVFCDVMVAVCAVVICYFIITVRGTLPRYRYDLLMEFCWTTMLPISFSLLSFFVMCIY